VARYAQIDKSGALKDIEIQSYVDSSEGPEAMPRSRLAGPSQEVLNDEELKFGLGDTNLYATGLPLVPQCVFLCVRQRLIPHLQVGSPAAVGAGKGRAVWSAADRRGLDDDRRSAD
jgi:hypothetical protein